MVDGHPNEPSRKIVPACPNGICPGLGHASYLPDTNVLDAKASIGDRAIFRDALLVDAMSG